MKKRITTSAVLLLMIFSLGSYAQVKKNTNTNYPKVNIDYSTTYQTIEGMGGFGPKKVWWSDPPFYDQQYLDMIIDSLGVTMVRTQLYWDFEESNDNDDPNVINWDGFNFDENSNNGKQLAFMQDLDNRGVKQIATVWTPPIWMKLEPDNSLAHFCNGQCGGYLNPDLYEEFAEYLVAYIQMLKNEIDLDLYAISLQNELSFANRFESCIYTPEQFAELLKVVGQRFENDGITTKIFGPEHMGNYSGNLAFFNEVFDDPEAEPYIDAWAVHGYQDGVTHDYGDAPGWSNMYDKCNEYGKSLWMTETGTSGNTWSENGMPAAEAIFLALKYGKVSAWVWWYIRDELMNIGETTLPSFYASMQYFRFLRPGALQIESNIKKNENVLVTAYHHPITDTTAVILLNIGDEEKTVRVRGTNAPVKYRHYVSSMAYNFEQMTLIENGVVTLPAKSITTLVSEENSPITMDKISPQYALMNDNETQSFQITGIQDNGQENPDLTIRVSTTVPELFTNLNVSFDDNTTATVTYDLVSDAFGEGEIIVTVENANPDETRIQYIDAEILKFINQPPTIDQKEDVYVNKAMEERLIKLTGISDGDDGSQNLSFNVTHNAGSAITSPKINYIAGEDTAQIEFWTMKKAVDAVFTVTVQDDGGTAMGGNDFSEMSFNVHIGEYNSIKDIKNDFTIFPNPAEQFLKIHSVLTSFNRIEISAIDGKTLISKKFDNHSKEYSVHTKKLPHGLYFIRIFDNEKMLSSFKFLKE